MKLKEMKKEELEILSYADLTEMIIKENKKSMNTANIFKKICNLLDLTEDDFSNKIGDFYTSLTTDKRFILLSNSEWDLRDKHKLEINLDDDMDDEDIDEEDSLKEEDNDTEESSDDESIEITDDEVDLDDDMEDLSIVDDEELERDDI